MRSDPADDYDRDAARPECPAYVTTTSYCVECRCYVPARAIAGERDGGMLCAACAAEWTTAERAARAAVYSAMPSVATRSAYLAARSAEVRAWQRVRPTPRLVHGCAS